MTPEEKILQLQKDLAIARKTVKELSAEKSALEQEVANLKDEIYYLKNPSSKKSKQNTKSIIRQILHDYMEAYNRTEERLILDPQEAVDHIEEELRVLHQIIQPKEVITDVVLEYLQE